MCRLCLFTPTMPALHKRMLFDLTLTLNNADKIPQRDGWGVSDGETWFKGSSSYRDADVSEWITELDPALPWMGHLRNASANTSLTATAAHPYEFPSFIAIHNGNFQGTTSFVPVDVKDTINTDSWRCFYRLQTLLDKGAVLDKAMIEGWLSGVEQGSAFVCMIMHNSQTHIVRGPNTRDLYFIRFANGFIFNTDDNVLKRLSGRLKLYFKDEPSEVFEFPEFHYAVVEGGKPSFEVFEKFDYKPKIVQVASNTRTDTSAWNRQTGGTWVRTTAAEAVDDETEKVLTQWAIIKQRMYPIRSDMIRAYLDSFLQKAVATQSYKEYTSEELIKVAENVKNLAFSDSQREEMIAWNKRVPPSDEVSVFKSMFGESGWLWEVPNLGEVVKSMKVEKGVTQ